MNNYRNNRKNRFKSNGDRNFRKRPLNGHKNHGEFKSIRVHDNFRNKGNGIKIINHLIGEAKKLNINRISIETGAGEFFEPARKLFKRCNFKSCEPFAHYKKDINSLYLTKLISN